MKSIAVYLLCIGGSLWLFMTLAPLFGYLTYSDRPGPGWYGSFPALSPSEFFLNALDAFNAVLFMTLLMAQVGVVCVLVIRMIEIPPLPSLVVKVSGGAITGVLTSYGIAGAGWYLALGLPAMWVTTAAGVFAGVVLIPRGELASATD